MECNKAQDAVVSSLPSNDAFITPPAAVILHG